MERLNIKSAFEYYSRLQPAKKVLVLWSVIIPVGLYSFMLATSDIENRRKALMKERRKLRKIEAMVEEKLKEQKQQQTIAGKNLN